MACRDSDESLTAICKRFRISRKNGYKWLACYEEAGLTDGAGNGPNLRELFGLHAIERLNELVEIFAPVFFRDGDEQAIGEMRIRPAEVVTGDDAVRFEFFA